MGAEDATNRNTKEQHLDLLQSIDEKLALQVSYRRAFALGVIRGLGVAVGATVIAAIALAILSNVIQTVDDVPVIRDIIDEAEAL